MTVSNKGPASAPKVLAALLVPRGVTVTSAGGGTNAFGTVFWTAGVIPTAGSVTYTVTFKVGSHAAGTVLIPAATASLSAPDPNYFNNLAATTVRLGNGSGGVQPDTARRPLRNPFPANQGLAAALVRRIHAHQRSWR